MSIGFMNKKASEVVISALVYIIIAVIVIFLIISFISRIGKGAPVYEELYSKQTALVIDKALVGTNITMDISKLYEISKKNNFNGEMIEINNTGHFVLVRLTSGKGHSYKFFSNYDILWNIKENEKRLYIYIIGNPVVDLNSVVSGKDIANACLVNVNNCLVLNAPCKCPAKGDLYKIKDGEIIDISDCVTGQYCYYGVSGCENPTYPEEVGKCKESLGTGFVQAKDCILDIENKVTNAPCSCATYGEVIKMSRGENATFETCVSGQYCYYNEEGCRNDKKNI
jgi:hypothetical protein